MPATPTGGGHDGDGVAALGEFAWYSDPTSGTGDLREAIGHARATAR